MVQHSGRSVGRWSGLVLGFVAIEPGEVALAQSRIEAIWLTFNTRISL